MSTRAQQHVVDVIERRQLSNHLVRLVLGGPGLSTFTSTGIPDEWVGLIVPGQFQSRYYTVTALDDEHLVVDVVVHQEGLVTSWAVGDCVGDQVTITDPKGSFAMPDDAGWLHLVGDLTAMPALARILTEVGDRVPTRVWCEVPDDLTGYLPEGADVTWSAPPADQDSALAALVEEIDFPAGPGYFWMAGESAQMRAIRKHLMRVVRLASTQYDVMGYWRGGGQRRQPRAVDPGPIWSAGKAAGKSDEQIWADYDAAQEAAE
ncbi:siderophore-interacting protein [Nocardioides limicola]|uniref:siderophore-interacting protein n=1 Tax=Nocardioides limicola TaxID=2803368 RepID=UPI00193C35ED|nr:siderophore-interacting protein [Nocardioides sp. DJM-14]